MPPPPLPIHAVDLKTTEVNSAVQQLKKLLLRGDLEHILVAGRRQQVDTDEWEWIVSSIRYPEPPPQEDPE